MHPEYDQPTVTEPAPSDPPHPKWMAEQMEKAREQARQAADFHDRKAREARQTLAMCDAALEQQKIAAIEDRKAASDIGYDRG